MLLIIQRMRLLLTMSTTEAHTDIVMEVPMMNSGSRIQKNGVMAMRQCRTPGRDIPGCALLTELEASKMTKSSEDSTSSRRS